MDLLRQQRKKSRENFFSNNSYSSSNLNSLIHYRDEPSSLKDNCCCYWISKKYYCFRRFKRRILGFRKSKGFYDQKSRCGGKRRINNKLVNKRNNHLGNHNDSAVFRRKSIVYRCNKSSNRFRTNSCSANFDYSNNSVRATKTRYLQSRSVKNSN